MSEGANIDYSGLSDNEAESELAKVDEQLAVMEDKRQTQTKEFIELLRKKLGLSERLKHFKEVNACEMRIRFIEARMRGEDMPHTEYVNLERKERRKRRNKTNTMLIVVVAIVVMMIGSVPMIKMMVEKVQERNDAIANADGNHDAPSTVVTPPPVSQQPPPTTPTADSSSATAAPTTAAPSTTIEQTYGSPPPLPSIKVDEINATTGGQVIDLKKILKPGRITALYFHSIHCPSCVTNKPKYAQLAAMYPQYKFYTVDVDRPFSEEIDRQSPVCQQFGITHYPFYMIFNGTQEAARGKEASTQMRDWYVAKAPK